MEVGRAVSAPPVSGVPPSRTRRNQSPARLARVLRQQEALRAVIESISSELELRPLLTRIVRHACELIGADNGTIGLVDEERGVVRTEAVWEMPPNEIGAEMGPGVGVAGHVLATGKPIILGRYGDLANPTQLDLVENRVVGIPISWAGRMIGFFGIGRSARKKGASKRRVPRFTKEDADTLALFARHAAIAIHNAQRYDRERRRTERLSLIGRVGRIIAADLRLDDVLQRAADAIHDLLGYQNVAIPLIEPDNPETLVLTTVGGEYRSLLTGEYRIPITRGIMAEAARTRSVVLVNDVRADPRHMPTPGAKGIIAELAVPILHGDRTLGVLNVESPSPFDDEDAASLQIIADQLAVAIENARLYEAVQMGAILEERRRLARELHDSVTQHLFSMTLIAQSIQSATRRNRPEVQRRVGRLIELSQSALAEMRALLVELRPASPAEYAETAGPGLARVERVGLAAALHHLADEMRHDYGPIEIALAADQYLPQPVGSEAALYRIAQEALANVMKHARARRVTIDLSGDDRGVALTVRDDGCGFDPNGAPRSAAVGVLSSGGLGLGTMRERTMALGGSFDIASTPNVGTEVRVTLPPQRMLTR
jgi:signal transduction histidine kinase